MRSVKSEILYVSMIAALPVAIVTVFPREAVGFKAANEKPLAASAVFVELTAAEEAEALNAARAAWGLAKGAVKGVRARPSLGDLKEEEVPISVPLPPVVIPDASKCADPSPRPWSPSEAAAPLKPLKTQGAASNPPAFRREELLELHP